MANGVNPVGADGCQSVRGVKPGEIPIGQPSNFELVINLKTAPAIGHQVPVWLVLRADKVIE
jgi:putative tryptophan/tyrosine transport system substrate-binding protein